MELRQPKPITQSSLWPDFQKKIHLKIGRFDQMSQLYTLCKIFQIKTKVFLTVLLKFFSCETNKFWKYLVIIKSYVKMFVIMAKICLRKKCYNFGLNSDTSLKILYNSFKAINYNMKIFRLLPFNLIEKQAIKQCHGRVGQGRFITNIPSTCGNIFFCSWIMCLKSMLSDR